MATAMGVLRWSPQQFWDATFYDYSAAMDGYMKAKGISTQAPVTRDEFLDMKEQYG